jgi:hypothetical protein
VTDSYGWDNSFDDVEAMVRCAGQYVRSSDDLRPRVLEAARLEHREQRAIRRIRYATLLVLLLAFVHISEWQGFDSPSSLSSSMLAAAGFPEAFSPQPAASSRSGDGDWRMVDAFTELRRQQAQLLRFEF